MKLTFWNPEIILEAFALSLQEAFAAAGSESEESSEESDSEAEEVEEEEADESDAPSTAADDEAYMRRLTREAAKLAVSGLSLPLSSSKRKNMPSAFSGSSLCPFTFFKGREYDKCFQ